MTTEEKILKFIERINENQDNFYTIEITYPYVVVSYHYDKTDIDCCPVKMLELDYVYGVHNLKKCLKKAILFYEKNTRKPNDN